MPCDIGKSSDIENVDWSTGTGSGPHYTNVVRFGSSSSQASQSSGDICRICHCESDPQNPLLTPCYCSGSLKYVHQTCLQQWLTASETNSCELCKFPFIMHTKIKPFNEWRSLDISGVERRRLCCSVLFHCAAALCVIWSLCVLIERAAEDVKRGIIDWPFWTKLAVVTVGLTGGVVFMYIQCKAYLHLCHRWRARNRILLIQNAPEKVHPLSPPSPILHSRNIPHNSNALVSHANTTNNYNYNSFNYPSASAAAAAAATGARALEDQQDVVDIQPTSVSNIANQSVTNGTGQYPQTGQHGQIVANIESNSHNYDRDWTLDDVSQISSFRPCPQGSGSMTPFHDSIHNVLEHSHSGSNSVNGSRQDLSPSMASGAGAVAHPLQPHNTASVSSNSETTSRTTNSYVFKPTATTSSGSIFTPTNPHYHHHHRYSNSSVFLENRDILNDSGFPKINYRHSSVLTSPDISDNLDKFLGKDLRRYSDTKLLTSDTHIVNSKFENTTAENDNSKTAPITIDALQSTNIFESAIQREQRRALFRPVGGGDATNPRSKLRLSLDTIEDGCGPISVSTTTTTTAGGGGGTTSASDCAKSEEQLIDRNRLFFKSLPNLSSSCESLIKK
ncbi:uncharacterized protein LOC129948500 [Eupeodes corollae]|uniref:uncharacterized protein LOC129948500 n=1 Tax=Eupeodes corollae TaxID=290404 RepID=UPI00248F7477|nr:uncharacterized protein LOC129948500 [Eupeodes corollae]XP_055915495.1 uncharacterized protein LOC129948500 [Eupeodes corollae]XP_055915496.1 uncharacterized protein LOC129948500 [Eupeodes corollae]XP_055915497.1 uncharacterized protein LOC129948500 [Eupeodes corollae]XP_055915498.1 uncharacterized protein LOC129948500 [Eupeodes corollae]